MDIARNKNEYIAKFFQSLESTYVMACTISETIFKYSQIRLYFTLFIAILGYPLVLVYKNWSTWSTEEGKRTRREK